MNFVIELLEIKQENNVIIVVIDRFNKERYYIVYKVDKKDIFIEFTI